MSLCKSSHYDLVIVGAGMVGASLSCILDQARLDRPLSILLVESAPVNLQAPPTQPSFDARTTVLSFGTVDYLKTLGLWEQLAEDTVSINHIHVSDQGRFGAVRMSSEEQGVEALGYVVENRLLGTMFNGALAKAESIELCSPVQVTSVRPLASGMEVMLTHNDQQTTVTTSLVVLAEGGRSGLCEKLGIERQSESYGQQAIIANVAFTKPHGNVAFERFTPKGPLALLPLPDIDGQHRAALVWTHPMADVSDIMALDDESFMARLQDEFGNRLGRFVRVGERHAYPLSLVQANEQVRPGLVLLGNVAHSLHPVAGQGFNLAFRDTMRLAGILLEGIRNTDSLGDIHNLQRYLEQVRKDQDRTAGFSHYMTRLFSTDNIAAAWIRKFGLFSIDLSLPLRTAFARRAMGLGDSRVQLDRRDEATA